jgi:HD-GYP domain-containing protein (c-di-GMP phosphodiesterase class II)
MLRPVSSGYGDIGAILWDDDIGCRELHALYGAHIEHVLSLVPGSVPVAGCVSKTFRALFGLVGPVIRDRRSEVGRRLASSLGAGDAVVRGFGQLFERWDGSGRPKGLAHDAIDRAVQVVQVAVDAQAMFAACGLEPAVALVRSGRGRRYSPAIADVFLARASAFLGVADPGDPWAAALSAEPGVPLKLRGKDIAVALAAIGEYADAKSHYFRGHSASVATIAAATAKRLGLPSTDIEDVRRAGFLHDLGRVSVPTEIWEKERPLTFGERERIRMHTYATERVLARASSLGGAAGIASLSHERLDQSGYHRRPGAMALPATARVLAVADVYAALREQRPHRAPFSEEAAAEELRRGARAGQFDSHVVEAALALGGHAPRPVRRPSGLSRREVEVLRLVARGLTNKEIAATLRVSARTVGHHLERAFARIGVKTRAAAGTFVVQNGLVHDADA